MSKHIAFLIMNMENGGGTERVTSVIANELVKRTYKVSIISCQCGNGCRFQLSEEIKLFSLQGEKVTNGITRKINTFRGLMTLVEKEKFDVIVAVDVALYCYLYPLQLMKKCKCIAWEHFNYHIVPNKLVKIGRKLAAEKADCCVVLGQRDLESYQKNYRCKNVRYIYNPIALNTSDFADMKRKRVIAVGRLALQKGFDRLLEAWKKVEEYTDEWSLDIFGEGEMKEMLQEQIANLHLKHCNLCGYAKNIEQEYLESSIFALSSRYEGFVLVLMEAQAKGLPCVSFDCKEGPSETIDDGVNGFLVEEGNIEVFSQKLITLISDYELRCRFAKNAKKDLYRFETSAIMDCWEDVFEKI